MTCSGIVTGLENSFAYVKVMRSSACAHCAEKCSAGCGEVQEITIKVKNLPGIKVGDTVELSSKSYEILFYAVLVFLVPVVFCIGGYFLGEFLNINPILFSCLSFLVAMILCALLYNFLHLGKGAVEMTKKIDI